MTPPWTIAELLERHPWPAEWASQRRLEWMWHYDLPVAPDLLWPAIADTSRMNRVLGVSEMKFEDRGGLRHGSSRPGRVKHEWVEVPWNWVAGQWLESLRVYERGFPRAVYAVYDLQPLYADAKRGGAEAEGRAEPQSSPKGRGPGEAPRASAGIIGTRLYIYFGAVPRNRIGALALRVGFPSVGKAYARVLPQVASQLENMRPAVLALPPPSLDPGAEARLASIRARLVERGLDARAVERLVDWVRTGDEQDLHRIQVRERARVWGVDEDELLRVALHATREGMLELSWDVVCPHCRGVTDENSTLSNLPASGGCEVCGIDFGTDSAEAVEITFHVHPSIRDVPKRTFCSAEPAHKDHIRVQLAVAPGASASVAPRLPAGRYRLRLDREKRYGFLDVGPASGGAIEWAASAPPVEVATPGAPSLTIVNDSSEPRTFIVETAQWTDTALRPGHLLSFQDFRDLYAEEYLGADVQLAIGEQTILFTDMVGSTAMYAMRGDPAAFVEVRRHFADVFRIISAHRGAVVKTIGDAAMGAFRDPLDAVKASAEIQRVFHPGRADTPARLRISLNTGPCIAVRLNTDIDYFGHTVNIAAKLQALAEQWQIAMSLATYEAPKVAAYLASEGAALEDLEYRSKAVPEGVRVKRWTLFTG
jgi:class 3 adenylate cyclase